MLNSVAVIKDIIKKRGIKITKVSEETGINYQRLNRIFNQHASLLASEFLALCKYLCINPEIFMDNAA